MREVAPPSEISDFLSEISSPAFVSGIKAAAEHTRRTGYHTSFPVQFHSMVGYEYPITIDVGTTNTANHLDGIDRERAFYQSLFGGPMPQGGRTHEALRKTVEARKLMAEHGEQSSIPFPHSVDYSKKNELALLEAICPEGSTEDEQLEIQEQVGNFTHLAIYCHVTPDSTPFAIGEDLFSINLGRLDSLDQINPISVVVVASPDAAGSYDMALYRGITLKPLEQKSRWSHLAFGLKSGLKSYRELFDVHPYILTQTDEILSMTPQ